MSNQTEQTIIIVDIVEGDQGCALCGKDLDRKHAVILSVDGITAPYGTYCAATLLGYSNKAKFSSVINDEAVMLQRVRNMVASGHDLAKVAKVATSKYGLPFTVSVETAKKGLYRFGNIFEGNTVLRNTPFIAYHDRKGNARAIIEQPVAVEEYDHVACLEAAGWLN